MSKTENTLAFIVNQKGSFLKGTEKAVINYIASFSNDAHKDQSLMAIDLGISIRTIQRAINKLLKYGLITRSYRLFKKVTYKLVELSTQIAIINNIAKNGIQTARNFVDKIRDRIKNKSVKSSVLSQVSDVIPTLVPQSTKENKFKENNSNIDKIFKKSEPKLSLEEKRMQALHYLMSMKTL